MFPLDKRLQWGSVRRTIPYYYEKYKKILEIILAKHTKTQLNQDCRQTVNK